MRPLESRSRAISIALCVALCATLAAAPATPARAAAESGSGKESPLKMRPAEALFLSIPDARETASISRQDVLDELHDHFSAVAPHLDEPEAVVRELSARMFEPGTPYRRILAGQALAGAMVKQRAFLQVRHHLLSAHAESPVADGIRRYQSDKERRERLIEALEPPRRAAVRVAARDRAETRDVLDHLFLDDSLPAREAIPLPPSASATQPPGEGSRRVEARIAELQGHLVEKLRALGFAGKADDVTIDTLERLRGSRTGHRRVGALRGILAELRVLESLRGKLVDAHCAIIVPYLGDVGEIDGETADHYIEVASGNQRPKTKQLKLLAPYAATRGKKGLIVYIDPAKADTEALGRFVEIALGAVGSIEFRPIPWRR